jgi:subtilisin family serine protease
VATILAIVFSTGSLSAQTPQTEQTALKERLGQATRPQGNGRFPEGTVGGPMATASGAGTAKVIIELTGEPTAVVYSKNLNSGNKAQAVTAAQAQLVANEQAQQQLLSQLQGLNATVLYRTQRVLNNIAVRVNVRDLPAIMKMSGVKSVRPLVTKHLDNTTSVPLIGAPDLWNPAEYGLTGEGISIAVIDTGIDYLHANFGGPGTAAAYAANDRTIITDTNGFPTSKVIGGWDFAGDDYAPGDGGAAEIPDPDPDPLDCNGHGSHVAGTAAGFGVTKAGATYTGPYTQSMNLVDRFRIGPGVAPKASLYALKVFGCDGSTDVTDVAIEWAVDPNGDGDLSDHVDVINMSLGSDFGGSTDSSALASDNAVLAGVIVVTSAGNSGDTNYISGSPGSAKNVIATASSVDSSSLVDAFRVLDATANPGLNKLHPGSNSVAYPWDDPSVVVPPTSTLPLTAVLYVPPVGERSGCSSQPFSAATKAAIVGKIVLLDWIEPSCGGSVQRSGNVKKAGGVGTLMIDYDANNPDAFDLFITGDTKIPAQSIPKDVGDALKAEVAANPNVKVNFSRQYNQSTLLQEPQLIDTMSDFSSRGPNSDVLKPDVTAPGQSIFSTGMGTGNQGANLSGTSMASPHVAGSMALLRELHPGWSVEELKALVMNTATQDIRTLADPTSVKFGPSRQGAGRVVLPNAADDEVLAYSQDNGMVSVFFGNVEVFNSLTRSKNFIVENKGTTTRSYDLELDERSTITGVGYALSDTSITVDAGDVAIVTLTMTATAADMLHNPDPALNLDQSGAGVGRFWQSEAGAYVNFYPAGPNNLSTPAAVTPALRLPVFANVRPASLMQAASNAISLGISNTASLDITLQGSDIFNSVIGTEDDIISLVHALELQTISPNDSSSEGILNAADLQFVGAMSDVSVTDFFTETMVSIGLSTHADWNTPSTVEFDVLFDTNGDGEFDYAMYNSNFAQTLNPAADATDDFLSVVVNLSTGDWEFGNYLNSLPPGVLDTNLFNSNVLVMSTPAELLGLTAADSDFNYLVVSYHRNGDGPVDVSPVLYYDAGNPGIDTNAGALGVGSPLYFDLAGDSISVDFNRAAASKSHALGVLLLHHNNITGRRAEVVSFQFTQILNKLYLPLLRK